MMSTRKTKIGIASLVVGALALTSCGAGKEADQRPASIEEMEPRVLRIADWDAGGSTHILPIQEFAQAVEERTGGKITFDEFYSGSLYPANETLAGVGAGVADFGRIVPSYTPQDLPVNNWLTQLGSTSSASFPQGLIQGSATSQEFLTTNDDVVAEFERHNVIPLQAMNPSQDYSLICTKPIESTEQTRGMRARTPGALWGKELNAIGIEPVSVAIGEVYEGMQRGVVDCTSATLGTIIDQGLWEVGKQFVPASMSQLNSLTMVMNKDTWESLPEDAQGIIHDAAMDTWGRTLDEVLKGYGRFASEGISEHEIEFNDPRELDEVLKAHQEKVVLEMAKNAPPGISDPEGFLKDYLALQDKWLNTVIEELEMPETPRDPETIAKSYLEGSQIDVSPINDALRALTGG
jgi:TRAP-type C4-dicarboxylate transport system substrate-binding protein